MFSVDTQYIPRVFNMIKSAMFRVTNKNEGKLLAALNVVGDSIKCLDGPTLHDMLVVSCLKLLYKTVLSL